MSVGGVVSHIGRLHKEGKLVALSLLCEDDGWSHLAVQETGRVCDEGGEGSARSVLAQFSVTA